MRISFEFIRRKLSRIYSRNPHLQGSNWFRKLKKTYIEMSMKYINTIDRNLKNIYLYGRNDFEFDLNRSLIKAEVINRKKTSSWTLGNTHKYYNIHKDTNLRIYPLVEIIFIELKMI